MEKKVKVLVTGANGFLGKNLVTELNKNENVTLYLYDINLNESMFEYYCKEADYVYHFAGVNRPRKEECFHEVNYGLTKRIVNILEESNNNCPIVFSSSIHAAGSTPYGKSKKLAENILISHKNKMKSSLFIFRFPNIFGKWAKPNYNSVVATFCNNVAKGLPISINKSAEVSLVYVEDVVNDLINILNTSTENNNNSYCYITPIFNISIAELAKKIQGYHSSRINNIIQGVEDDFSSKLYSTYLSYLDKSDFSYSLTMNSSSDSTFTEFIRMNEYGQVSVNILEPGITKGNHWHRKKSEKFFIVSGKGIVRFRKVNSDEVTVYLVSEDKHQVIDIPPGYIHNIENTGTKRLVTIIWASEMYNPDQSDTFSEEV